jgi:hypothetical protein
MSLARSIAAFAAIAAGAACSGGPPRVDPIPANCSGTPMVEVTNSLGAHVDIYTYVGGSERWLGTASGGTNRFTLPPNSGYSYFFAKRLGQENPQSRNRVRRGVSYRTICEP